MLAVTLDFPNTREGGTGPTAFVLTRSLDIFVVVRSNLSILVTPGATGRAYIFSRCSILRTFNNRINWETSCDKFFGSHGSHGAFDSSHLTNIVTGTKK
jgi:hypothetical protein